MIKLYFSTLKIVGLTQISAVATVLLITKTFKVKQRERQRQTEADRKRGRETERDRETETDTERQRETETAESRYRVFGERKGGGRAGRRERECAWPSACR